MEIKIKWILAYAATLFSFAVNQGSCADHYSVIFPRSLSHRHKRSSGALDEKVVNPPELSISIELFETERILDLRLQRNLLPDNFVHLYQLNGTLVKSRSDQGSDFCHYHGAIRNVSNSWAAVSVCDGTISGSVYDGNKVHHIVPEPEKMAPAGSFGKHKVYHSVTSDISFCDSSTSEVLARGSSEPVRVKRSSKVLPEPYGVSSKSRYVEMVIVVDNKIYLDQNSDMAAVKRRCKDVANIVNALYAPLNIYIALVGIVVWSEKDEVTLSTKGDETLTNFLHYRKMRLVHEIPNDNAQLITGVQFQGGVVGKALKGPICTYEFSGGVSMDHNPIVGLVATTVAHELGHNFGMEHDNDTQCVCEDDRCIMAASSSSNSPTKWSSCSKESIIHAFEHGMDYCLHNRPKSLVEGPVCGNMFVEPGEECDCGLLENCKNPCCNAATCKLFPNATCGTGPCCDMRICQPKSAGTECRSSRTDCDLPEYCTGNSEFCPNDVFKQDGTSCSQSEAYCYQGKCSTHSDQCRLLWGSSGNNSDPICYRQNIHGNRTGHCGFDRPSQNYSRCQQEDILCGALHCSHLNERLEFGMESVSVLSHSFYNVGGKIIPCRTASIDLGLSDRDPGLVPNGAKCGEDKMCLNQKCVSVSTIIGTGCPFNCHGNGVCNSNSRCHCKVGFAPPYCDYPGFGGSEDSGPATNPMGSTYTYLMMFFFLGLIPVFILLAFCYYYYRNPHKRHLLWEKFKQPRRNISQRPDILPIHLIANERPAETTQTKPEQEAGSARRNMFGKYKGFTLSPLKEQPEEVTPTTPAEPPKIPPPKPAPPQQNSRVAFLASTFVQKPVSTTPASSLTVNKTAIAPPTAVVTPSSVGVVAAKRPVISGPVLNHSTSSTLPVRPAPPVPKERKTESPTNQPLLETVQVDSMVEVTVTSVVPSPRTEKRQRPVSSPTAFLVKQHKEEPKGGERESKIFSNPFFQRFFRSDQKPSDLEKVKVEGDGTLKKNLKRLDRQSLRNLDISAPITQDMQLSVKVMPVRTAPEPPSGDVVDSGPGRLRFGNNVSDSEEENLRASVERTNSMRISNVTPKPKIPKFGSMRRSKRPVSMPSARPKSPPPNPPAPPVSTIPRKDTYFVKDKSPEYLYDDCLSKKELITPEDLSENFYENIDEKSGESRHTDEDDTSAASDDGLLSEIVSELSKKDNVYATAIKKSDRNTPEPLEQPVKDLPVKTTESKPLTGLISKPLFTPTSSSLSKSEAPRSAFSGYSPKTTISSPASSFSSVLKKFNEPTFTLTSTTASPLSRATVSTSVTKTNPTSFQSTTVVSSSPSLSTSSSSPASSIAGKKPTGMSSLLASYSTPKNPVSVATGSPSTSKTATISTTTPFSYLNTAKSDASTGFAQLYSNMTTSTTTSTSSPLSSSNLKPTATSATLSSTTSAKGPSSAFSYVNSSKPATISSSTSSTSSASSTLPLGYLSSTKTTTSNAPLGSSNVATPASTFSYLNLTKATTTSSTSDAAATTAPFTYLNSRASSLIKPVATITPNTASSGSLVVSKPSSQMSFTKTTASSTTSTNASVTSTFAGSLVKVPPPLPSVGPVAEIVTGVGSIKVDRPDYTSQSEPKVMTSTTVTFSVSSPVVTSRPEGEGVKTSPLGDKGVKPLKPKTVRVTSPVRTTVKPVNIAGAKPVTTSAGKVATKTVASKPSGAVITPIVKAGAGRKPGAGVQSKTDSGLKKT